MAKEEKGDYCDNDYNNDDDSNNVNDSLMMSNEMITYQGSSFSFPLPRIKGPQTCVAITCSLLVTSRKPFPCSVAHSCLHCLTGFLL